MKDTITQEDLLVDTSKTEIEQELVKTRQENDLLKEHIESHNVEVRQLKSLVARYLEALGQIKDQGLTLPA